MPFFHESAVLDSLARTRLRPGAGPARPLRAWVPYCATGENAYSLAARLIELLGRRWREVSLRVLATDPDPFALRAAREGLYPRAAARAIPEERLRRFFVLEPAGLRVGGALRQACRFLPHDPRRPPFAGLDLVACGAAMKALPPAARREASRAFSAALAPGGVLVDASGRAARRAALEAAAPGPAAADAGVDDVVHELRAPLAVIQGAAEAVRRDGPRPRERRGFMRAIERQAARMGRLVDGLLDLGAARGRRRAAAPAVALAAAVAEAAAVIAVRAARRGVAFRGDVDPGLRVRADPADLAHILINLLDNAVKYNRPRGRVRVRARAAGAETVLSVADDGVGIPPEDLPRLFERFYRSERTRAVKGTGLGLAIVRGMAEANGGRVWCSPAPGGGSVFHVALPSARGGGA